MPVVDRIESSAKNANAFHSPFLRVYSQAG
jgi:hypothetical protein